MRKTSVQLRKNIILYTSGSARLNSLFRRAEGTGGERERESTDDKRKKLYDAEQNELEKTVVAARKNIYARDSIIFATRPEIPPVKPKNIIPFDPRDPGAGSRAGRVQH